MRTTKFLAASAVAALFAVGPAIAADTSDMKSSSPTNSGPGVKGAPGGTNGPALKSDSASPPASTGAGSGDKGVGDQGAGMSPSQDATGVQGAPDSTNGPSTKKPGDTGMSQ